MGVLGLVVQCSENSLPTRNLAVVTRKQLRIPQAVLISKEFAANMKIREAEESFGSFIILDEFLVTFQVLSEVFVYVISLKTDNPFQGAKSLNNAKDTLTTLCKGTDITVMKLNRSPIELQLGLQKALDSGYTTQTTPLVEESDPPNKEFANRITELNKIQLTLPAQLFCTPKEAKPAPPPRRK